MIALIVLGSLVGLFSALLGKLFDALLDYGALFGIVRYRLAHFYARDDKDMKNNLRDIALHEDYGERLSLMNEAYWEICAKKFWFTGWVCLKCFSERLCLIACACFIPYLLKCDSTAISIFVFILIAESICHFVIDKTS